MSRQGIEQASRQAGGGLERDEAGRQGGGREGWEEARSQEGNGRECVQVGREGK